MARWRSSIYPQRARTLFEDQQHTGEPEKVFALNDPDAGRCGILVTAG